MKKILITGANSYIGVSFERYILKNTREYACDTIDMLDDGWRSLNFSSYDAVLHVAGIAHRKESKKNAELYYTVNRDLAFEVAKKAKQDGAKHFLFLSSMSVYGMTTGRIFPNTVEVPNTHYGQSKLEAEKLIAPLADDNFIVTILRPPMVYGDECKGNYQQLRKLAIRTSLFPSLQNERSMIHIDNLSSAIEHAIRSGAKGVLFPQNSDYMSTVEMVETIASFHGKCIRKIGSCNPLISFLARRINLFAKVFGSLTYDQEMNVNAKWLVHKTNHETLVATEKQQRTRKVLIVATVTKKHINVFHLPVLKWFQEQGWKTYVAANNDFDPEEEASVPYSNEYRVLPFSRHPFSKDNVSAYRQLKKWIDEEQFDLIHCHTPVAGIIARLAARKARKNGCKVFYTAHGFHFFKGAPLRNWLLFYPAERFCARFTDVLLTVNQEDFSRAKQFHAKRIEHINGVGVDVFAYKNSTSPDVKKEFLATLGIDYPMLKIVSVGELNANKNQSCIIRALAKARNKNICYLLCGCGPMQHTLQALAKELGVADRVRFLGFRKDVPFVLSVADVFAFPSKREGLPVSVIEAMAAGLPVICSDVRGNRELILNNINGYVCRCDDVDQFTTAIDFLAENAELRVAIGEKNMCDATRYSESEVMRCLTRIYQEVVGCEKFGNASS